MPAIVKPAWTQSADVVPAGSGSESGKLAVRRRTMPLSGVDQFKPFIADPLTSRTRRSPEPLLAAKRGLPFTHPNLHRRTNQQQELDHGNPSAQALGSSQRTRRTSFTFSLR